MQKIEVIHENTLCAGSRLYLTCETLLSIFKIKVNEKKKPQELSNFYGVQYFITILTQLF
jgi:hypothetical protein